MAKWGEKSRHKSYRVWINMIYRCTKPEHPLWQWYGGRGITVCKEWKTWERFHADMGDPPEGLTLDRIDNSKGYSKDNCRWITMKEQAGNRRNTCRTQLYEFRGKSQTLKDWAKELGIRYTTLYMRIVKNGWDPVEALSTTPSFVKRVHRKATAGGVS
jgi:hypothetical protein